MVSQSGIDAIGAAGGVILALCQAPQLIKLYRTKSASDLSFSYIILYTTGLMFICIYLFLERAVVGFVCEVMEFSCGLTLVLAKWYLDSRDVKRRREAQLASGEGSATSSVAGPCGAGADGGSSGVALATGVGACSPTLRAFHPRHADRSGGPDAAREVIDTQLACLPV